jgi:hypothetical protein
MYGYYTSQSLGEIDHCIKWKWTFRISCSMNSSTYILYTCIFIHVINYSMYGTVLFVNKVMITRRMIDVSQANSRTARFRRVSTWEIRYFHDKSRLMCKQYALLRISTYFTSPDDDVGKVRSVGYGSFV